MESAPRAEVETFTQACRVLADFVHHHKLTEEERNVVVSFVRALEMEVHPPGPLLFPDVPPVAATISNFPPID